MDYDGDLYEFTFQESLKNVRRPTPDFNQSHNPNQAGHWNIVRDSDDHNARTEKNTRRSGGLERTWRTHMGLNNTVIRYRYHGWQMLTSPSQVYNRCPEISFGQRKVKAVPLMVIDHHGKLSFFRVRLSP